MPPEKAKEWFKKIHESVDKDDEAHVGEKRGDMKMTSETKEDRRQKTIEMTEGLHLKDNPPLDHVRAWEAEEEARQENRAKRST